MGQDAFDSDAAAELAADVAMWVEGDTGTPARARMQKLLDAAAPTFVSVGVLLSPGSKLVMLSNMMADGCARMCLFKQSRTAMGKTLASPDCVVETCQSRATCRDIAYAEKLANVQTLAVVRIPGSSPEAAAQGSIFFGWESPELPSQSLPLLKELAEALAPLFPAATADLTADVMMHFLPCHTKVTGTMDNGVPADASEHPGSPPQGPAPPGAPPLGAAPQKAPTQATPAKSSPTAAEKQSLPPVKPDQASTSAGGMHEKALQKAEAFGTGLEADDKPAHAKGSSGSTVAPSAAWLDDEMDMKTPHRSMNIASAGSIWRSKTWLAFTEEGFEALYRDWAAMSLKTMDRVVWLFVLVSKIAAIVNAQHAVAPADYVTVAIAAYAVVMLTFFFKTYAHQRDGLLSVVLVMVQGLMILVLRNSVDGLTAQSGAINFFKNRCNLLWNPLAAGLAVLVFKPRFRQLLVFWTLAVMVYLGMLAALFSKGQLSAAGLLFGTVWEVVLAYGVPVGLCHQIEYRLRSDFLSGVQAGSVMHSPEPLAFS